MMKRGELRAYYRGASARKRNVRREDNPYHKATTAQSVNHRA
jgi:hypothetical protein